MTLGVAITLRGNFLLEAVKKIPRMTAKRLSALVLIIGLTTLGAFLPFSQQPALQALMVPFGGYGGLALIEYLLRTT